MSNELLTRIKKNSKLGKLNTLDKSKFLKESDSTPTDMPVLNLAFSGELDKGFRSGLIQFAGPSKHFKTNLSLLCVKAYLDKNPNAICLFFDSEFGITEEYLKAQGIDPERMVHIPIMNIEEFKFELMAQLEGIVRGDKVIILIDSIGNLASKKEVEDALNEKGVADMTRAKQLKSLFRMATPYLTMKDIPMIGINHVYDTMSGLVPTKTVGGGCVVAGTKIQTEFGLKNIEDIQVGDLVNSVYGYQEVSHIWNPETLLNGNPECYEIEFEDGTLIKCSAEHKFIVELNEIEKWVEAQNLKQNNYVKTLDNFISIKSIKSIGKNPVYDISIKTDEYDKQQYILENGVISHNSGAMYSSNVVFIIGRSQEKDGTDLSGYTFTLNVEKSRDVREKSKLKFKVLFETGIVKYSGLLDIGIACGKILKPSNGWYSRVINGQQEDKKWRARDAETKEFWEPLLKDEEFKDACRKLYKLVATKIESDTATEIEDDIDLSQNIDMSDVPSFDD
jgi:hypothetical protein